MGGNGPELGIRPITHWEGVLHSMDGNQYLDILVAIDEYDHSEQIQKLSHSCNVVCVYRPRSSVCCATNIKYEPPEFSSERNGCQS